MPPRDRIVASLDAQHGGLFPWVPVCLATGIGTYFALPAEPATDALVAAGALAALLTLLARGRRGARPLLLGGALILAGLLLAALRAHGVGEPVLGYRYYGPVEGRIVTVDRSASDKVRLTLDRVVLERTDPDRTPDRVRISLHGRQGFVAPEPGMRGMATAFLSPPSGPVEPGGFDFRRNAWFDRLGAIGYTREPVLAVAPAEAGLGGLWMTSLRDRISGAVQTMMPGRTGAFAAAIMTGDRSGMDADTLTSLRASNLAHLLAISGLHMGLLTGFVFAAIRYGLALVPPLALRWPTKKLAALGALGAGAFYLGLSGGNVATERAFVMVSVMLVGVLLDRRAISLRAVALAAIIVLVLRPEALIGPGFQMSFAATTALVAVFGWLRDRKGRRLPRWVAPVAALATSSAVAGAATAPIGAAHFNQLAHYGLLANMISVPLMGAVVIPAAVLSALLAPLGLAAVGLALMRPALAWILGVADWVAGLDGAVSQVVAPPAAVLPLFALGGLTIVLWRGGGRAVGLVPLVAAFALWTQAERPPILVSSTGGLVGAMTEAGRVLSKPTGEGFAAGNWLENDGDGADQEAAAARAGFTDAARHRLVEAGGLRLAHITGRDAAERVGAACAAADLVVVSTEVTAPAGCRVLHGAALERTGAVAIWPGEGAPRLVAVADSARRLWTGHPPEPSRLLAALRDGAAPIRRAAAAVAMR